MMSKTMIGVSFAAGCALAMAAMPTAQAQTYPPPAQPYMGPPLAQPYAGPPVVENQLVTNGPQASRGDFGDWSARRNNIESAHYDRLLGASRGFRVARMRKECGPISDPQLHEQCMASFAQEEPAMVGSSTPPRRLRSGYGY